MRRRVGTHSEVGRESHRRYPISRKGLRAVHGVRVGRHGAGKRHERRGRAGDREGRPVAEGRWAAGGVQPRRRSRDGRSEGALGEPPHSGTLKDARPIGSATWRSRQHIPRTTQGLVQYQRNCSPRQPQMLRQHSESIAWVVVCSGRDSGTMLLTVSATKSLCYCGTATAGLADHVIELQGRFIF